MALGGAGDAPVADVPKTEAMDIKEEKDKDLGKYTRLE